MSTSRLTIIVSGVVVISLAGFGSYEYAVQRRMRNEFASISADRFRLLAQLSERPKITPAPVFAEPAHPVARITPAQLAQETTAVENLDEELSLERMAIGKRYKDFFAEVHLSPEQQQRFGTLVINRDNAGGEVREAARLKGIDISEGPLLEQTVTEISSGVTNNLRELLGATGYTKLMEFERTAFLRVTSGSLNAKSPAAP